MSLCPQLRAAAWMFMMQAALLVFTGCNNENRSSANATTREAEKAQAQSIESVTSQDGTAVPSEVDEPIAAAEPIVSNPPLEKAASGDGASSRAEARQIVERGPDFKLPELPPPAQRRPLPKIEMVDISGETIRFEDLRGQVVLLVFWATWCKPCAMEIPHLIHMTEAYEAAGFRVVAPSVDRRGLADVKPFLEKNRQINYTIIPNGVPAAKAFGGVRGIPTSFLIDREGRIINAYSGLQPPEILEASVQAALLE